MNKEHHFIVSYNEATGTWHWNTDEEEARYQDGTIYNYDTNEWSSGYLGDGEYEPAEESLIGQLKMAINVMNIVHGKGWEE